MTALQLLKKLIKVQPVPLLTFFLITCFVTLGLEDQLMGVTIATDSQRWILQVAMGLFDLCSSLFLIFLLSWSLPEAYPWNKPFLEPKPFKEPYLLSFFAEYLRSLAQIILYSMLLLVPGFIRYSRLSLVPFIALFSKSYRQGDADALKLSENLSKGHFAVLFSVLFLTTVVDLALQLSPSMYASLHSYPIRIAFNLATLLISIWTYSFLFLVFVEANEKRA